MTRVAAVLAVTAATAAVGADWAVPDAPFRRVLKVETFDGPPRTASTLVFVPAPDGTALAGLRLFDAAGKSRPLRLVEQQGSRCSVFFDGAAPGATFELYFSPGKIASDDALPASGLLHRVRGYPGGAVKTAAQFDRLWEASREPQGGRFVAQVFDAFNPCGPNANSLHRYDGMLRLRNSGEYTFCVASTDAAFLRIDGQPVVAWPGLHEVRGGLRGQIRGKVTLKAGLHRFSFLHANTRADQCYALAAVIRPGGERHQVIPPVMFADAVYAQVGRLESRQGRPVADFQWENVYQVNHDGREMYTLHFEAPIRKSRGHDCRWDFGDGTSTATGASVDHIYFRSDTYRVRLETGGGDDGTAEQLVTVTPRWGQDERDERRAVAAINQAIKQERAIGIQPAGYRTIVRYCYFYLRETVAARFAPRALAHADRVPAADVAGTFLTLGLQVQQVDEQYELAERCFQAVLASKADATTKALAALHCAGMLNFCLNRPEAAREILGKIRAEDLGGGWEQRLLEIYRADTTLVLDGYAAAARQYSAIAATAPLIKDGSLDRDLLTRQNSRYLYLRNLIAQKLYRDALQQINNLEWEAPQERLNPLTNLLKAEALVGNRQPRKAAVCLERALLAEVDERYRPQLRLELGRLYFSLGDLIRARQQIRLIKEESPYSREEVEADKLRLEIEAAIDRALRPR